MKTENVNLMKMARESLSGKWGQAIGGYFVFMLITILVSIIPKIGSLASLIIVGPLFLGVVVFSLAISRNQESKIEQIFQGFNNFGLSVAAYLLMLLYIFLWSLLLIIPGIIVFEGRLHRLELGEPIAWPHRCAPERLLREVERSPGRA